MIANMVRSLQFVCRSVYRLLVENSGVRGWQVLVILAILSGTFPLFAQPPDCTINVTFTAVNQSAPTSPFNGLQNTNAGCTAWSLSVNATPSITAYTVALQSAPNNNGVPGTYVTFANQTLVTGTNPIVVSTSNGSGFVYLQGYNPWVRVQVTALTGTGTINGAAYGWRIPSASGSSGSSTVTITAPLGVQAPANGVSVTQTQMTLAVKSYADVTGDGSVHTFSITGNPSYCDVTAPSTNTGTIFTDRVGDASISATQGQGIPPGGSYRFSIHLNNVYPALSYLLATGDKFQLLCFTGN